MGVNKVHYLSLQCDECSQLLFDVESDNKIKLFETCKEVLTYLGIAGWCRKGKKFICWRCLDRKKYLKEEKKHLKSIKGVFK